MVPWTTEKAWGGPQGLGHSGLKNRSWGCGHAWQRRRGDGAHQGRAAWVDRGPRSLQPTAGLRKLSRGGHGGRRAEPGLPGAALSCSGLAGSAGQGLLLQAPRRGGHQRGLAGVPGPCLLGPARQGEDPAKGPLQRVWGTKQAEVGGSTPGGRDPECCGPSGPWLSPTGHRFQEHTPPRRIGTADLKAHTGPKRVPFPQPERDRWRTPEVSGEKNWPDTK